MKEEKVLLFVGGVFVCCVVDVFFCVLWFRLGVE